MGASDTFHDASYYFGDLVFLTLLVRVHILTMIRFDHSEIRCYDRCSLLWVRLLLIYDHWE